MIVVDTNLLTAFCSPTDLTAVAEAVWETDSDWHAPALWASEFRNAVVQRVRRGFLPAAASRQLMEKARLSIPPQNSHVPPDENVFDFSLKSGCGAYDCEFVAVAELLNVPFVTWDKLVLKQFPHRAVPPEAFVLYHRNKRHP